MARRLLIIEDHVTFTELIQRQLRKSRISGPAVEVRSHVGLLEDWPPTHTFSEFSMVFVDAYAGERQQTDERESIFVGLDILERLQAIKDQQERRGSQTRLCRVGVYSSHMRTPEVNIPVRDFDVVTACCDVKGLLDHVVPLLEGGTLPPEALVPPPTAADFEDLGVGPNARVAEAYRRMRDRPDAWELVWRRDFSTTSRTGFTPERKVAEFINDSIRPLLGIEVANYKSSVEVIRRISGLPR